MLVFVNTEVFAPEKMGVRVGWESLLVLLLVLCSLTTTTTATTALVTVIASNDYLESLEMLSNSLRINWPASHSLSKFCVCVALSDIMEDKVRKLGFTVLSFPRHFLYTHHKLRHVLTKNEMRGKYKSFFFSFSILISILISISYISIPVLPIFFFFLDSLGTKSSPSP